MFKTLKGKISLIYFCLVLFIAVVGITSFLNLYNLRRAINGLMTDNYKSISAITNMLESLDKQDSAVHIYLTENRQDGISIFIENSSSFLKWYNIEELNVTEKGEKELVVQINSLYAKYVKDFSMLQEINNSGGFEKSIEFYNNAMKKDSLDLQKSLKDLTSLNENAMFTEKERATSNANQSTYIILSLTVISIILGFALSKFFINRFLKPMNSLTSAVKEIKAGNLGHEAEVISNDEVGELAREFNNMTRRLLQFEQSTMGQLLDEKNKSLTIVKSISDPLIVLDTNYRIILLNDASENFFDIKEKDSIERHFLEVVRNGELFDFITAAKDVNEGTIQKIVSIKTGAEEHFFNAMVNVIKSDNKSHAGFVVLLQNVTQLKHLEKIRTDFIATISHEFKTPLTSIIMGTNLVQGEAVGKLNSEQKEIIGAIKEDGERLSVLVNDLLELTKIESGKAVYKIGGCSVVGIIENSIKQFSQLAEQKGVILLTNADKGLPRVMADYEKITWVLNNLISNALKYTKEGDHILVLAEQKSDKVYVTVKDTGVGIPEDYLNIIFDKFVQVKGGDFEMRGTGLGLAVVKEIVEAHEGKIWCESELDSGSSFTFTLNLA